MFSPLILSVRPDALGLSSPADGVVFDLIPGEPRERVSWPTQPEIVAFVVDDQNRNGVVDGGDELLGSFSPHIPFGARNAFDALATYDTDGSGVVNTYDAGFARLQLWFDKNRDGLTQQGELRSLADAGVIGLSLRYQELERRDEFGNVIAYRAKAFLSRGAGPAVQPGWLYDAYLRAEPAAVGTASQ